RAKHVCAGRLGVWVGIQKEHSMQNTLIGIPIAIGVLIAYVDSRPNWDDAGITAVAVFAASFLFAAIEPVRPWLWALCVGVWIPLYGIIESHNFGSLLALVFAFGGAYSGVAFRRILSSSS
ncbi:MAG: hypothetical protein WAN65_24345, partial [Candidatus Sulfotelmatobacter sp.]